VFIEAFVSDFSVETFDEGVLHWFSRSNEFQSAHRHGDS